MEGRKDGREGEMKEEKIFNYFFDVFIILFMFDYVF